MRGVFTDANGVNLFLVIFPHISLHCKQVTVRSQEYDYGPLTIGLPPLNQLQ